MARKPGKTEQLTIRLDPKTRFMLEFVARFRGQTITTVVERAIAAAADEVKIVEFSGPDSTWRDFWRVVEGERALLVAGEPELHPDYEEERRRAFARKHWAFFYLDPDCKRFNTPYIEILWPRIDELIEDDDMHKATDYYFAANKMQALLKDAGIEAPKWPQSPPKRPSSGPAFEPGGMDDDIPF